MKLQAVLLLFGGILAMAMRQQKCLDQHECVPFEDCAEYKEYVGKPNKLWPQAVRDKVKSLLCEIEYGQIRKIYKICCNLKTVNGTADLNSLTSSGKTGRDLLDLSICGRQNLDRNPRGQIAEVFDYPWMALLGNEDGGFHCGGSLIAESFVLTAAHCNRKKILFVRIGDTDLSALIDCNVVGSEEECAEPHQDFPVDKFIRQMYSASQKKNDIALVKLSQPAQFSYSVRPICLPFPEMLPKKMPNTMVVSRWGYTKDQNATSTRLRWATVPIIDQNECQESIRNVTDVYTVDESQVCAGADEFGADNCEGDSGGPLQYYGKTGFVVHGVVAWGVSTCGTDIAPGVYTKVAHYLDWIIDNLK